MKTCLFFCVGKRNLIFGGKWLSINIVIPFIPYSAGDTYMQVKSDRRRWAHIIIHPPLRSYYAPAAYKIRGSHPPLSGANHFDTHEPVELSKFVKPIFHRFVPPHPCTFFVKPILRNYSHHSLHKTGSTLLSIWDLPFYTFLPRPKK